MVLDFLFGIRDNVSMTNALKLKTTYVNTFTGHKLHPYAFDKRAGAVNEQILVHNFTTGYDETWSVRLFLAEHNKPA
jgi:hypothetical protein